jgi:hypothetical protein
MELTFRSKKFELCVRLGRVYNLTAEKYLNSAINVRFGKTVWTTGKGLRKIGQL